MELRFTISSTSHIVTSDFVCMVEPTTVSFSPGASACVIYHLITEIKGHSLINVQYDRLGTIVRIAVNILERLLPSTATDLLLYNSHSMSHSKGSVVSRRRSLVDEVVL